MTLTSTRATAVSAVLLSIRSLVTARLTEPWHMGLGTSRAGVPVLRFVGFSGTNQSIPFNFAQPWIAPLKYFRRTFLYSFTL